MATMDDVRRIALSLPETTEELWYGTPGFKVRGKGFLRVKGETDDRLVVFVTTSARRRRCSAPLRKRSPRRRTTTGTRSSWST